MTLKTRFEIQKLVATGQKVLDADRDGVVSDTELRERRALAADELDSFGIVDAEDWRYWTELGAKYAYKPETEVERGPDGRFVPVANPVSLRSQCVAAYENGRLMDEAMMIEGDSPRQIAAAGQSLDRLEAEWDAFHDSRAAAFDATAFRANFTSFCDEAAWRKSGRDPAAFVAKLNETEMRRLHEGALVSGFLKRIGVKYDAPQASFLDFLNGEPGRLAGTCAVIATFALHLLKRVGDGVFKPMIITKHVTLCAETSAGLVYLDAEAGFQPPGYYENQPPGEPVRRGGEGLSEPWQVLGAVYNNVGRKFYDGMDDRTAREYFEKALEICPENAVARYMLGSALENLRKPAEALKHYRKALELNPDYELARKAYAKLTGDL